MTSGNGISGLLNFKIFWGSMPPDPPRDWRLQHASGLSPPPPPPTQISSYSYGMWLHYECLKDQYLLLLLSAKYDKIVTKILMQQLKCITKYLVKVHLFHSLTSLEQLGQNLGARLTRALVPLLVAEYSASVNPVIVPWSQEHDRKLSWLVTHVLNVGWNIFWIADLCWPPPNKSMSMLDPCYQHVINFIWHGPLAIVEPQHNNTPRNRKNQIITLRNHHNKLYVNDARKTLQYQTALKSACQTGKSTSPGLSDTTFVKRSFDAVFVTLDQLVTMKCK